VQCYYKISSKTTKVAHMALVYFITLLHKTASIVESTTCILIKCNHTLPCLGVL